jgi:4-hydroxyphenylpyruvate dioxygenase
VSDNPIGLKRIHHLNFWTGNAKQAAFYYRNAFGFSQIAASGLESGVRDRASWVMRQGDATFVISSGLKEESPINDWVTKHGDGIRDIAFEVEDADAAFREAVARGAAPEWEPRDVSDAHGTVRWGAVRTYGDTIHSLISNVDYEGPFLPGFVEKHVHGPDFGIETVDHVVGNVELGEMETWASWYAGVLGFERYITFDDKDISTEYSALMSIVMSDGSQRVKFPINEPAAGKKKSQIDEYLEFNGGAGVQHVAMLTKDIRHTVRSLREAGVEFLKVPDTYYEALPDRVGDIDEEFGSLAELGVLVDRDEDGYLLQLFTKPVQDRPTVFFELIQREGCRGFGKGNFKALFEAIEREQAARGNL